MKTVARQKILAHLPRRSTVLEHLLSENFGGWTLTPKIGGWKPSTGPSVVEEGFIYDVSFEPSGVDQEIAIALFREAGKRMGETWVHMELHEFTAMHRKVS